MLNFKEFLFNFQKSDFKVTQENLISDYHNKSLMTVTEMKCYKLNRTMFGVKVNFTLLTELGELTTVKEFNFYFIKSNITFLFLPQILVKGYKFLSNTYRLTAIQFTEPIIARYVEISIL